MIADLFVFAVAGLAFIGLLTVCQYVLAWMEHWGWLNDSPLPWEQDKRGAA